MSKNKESTWAYDYEDDTTGVVISFKVQAKDKGIANKKFASALSSLIEAKCVYK